MSIQLEVVKNQPLGWSKVSEPECEDCREGDYCSPLAFVQDGSNWVSDIISFQGRYLGEVEGECDLLPVMISQEPTREPIGAGRPVVSVISDSVRIDFNGEAPETPVVEWTNIVANNCNYVASVIVEPQSGTASGFAYINGVSVKVDPGPGYDALIPFDGNIGGSLIITADTDVIVRLTFVSVAATCNLQPQGVKIGTTEYGTITTLVNEFKAIGDYVYQALNYQITLTNNQYNLLKGQCGTLTLSAGCCCAVEVESRCVRITEPTCDTLQFVYSQPLDGFGFAYPSGFNHYIRLIAVIRDPYFADEDFETYTDSAGRKNIIYSEPREAQVLSYTAPDYVHSAMALALRHENFRLVTSSGSTFYALVDGEEYRPNWGIERKIAKVVVELEIKQQQLWSKRCN